MDKRDVFSGFSVFLIALPLCLGIAVASNVPPVSGVLAACVGGIVCSFLGGCRLAIKGPAAGLIVISLSAVAELGAGDLALGYHRALAVGVVAGCFQIALAVFKKASLAEIMPPAVIHGMLAGIGIIIVSKQIYVMLGVEPTVSNPLALIFEIPHSLPKINPLIALIGVLSLLIVSFWPYLKKVSLVPSSIIVLLVTIPISEYVEIEKAHEYVLWGGNYHLSPEYLLNLPSSIKEIFQFPDFSVIYTWASIKYIFMFALVGSIESLLTVCAVDSMNSDKPPSDLNQDLLATGIGNTVSALIGGLPIISEIVRSKANIDYGAQSQWANFFHGLFLLLAILLFPHAINNIVLSSLAGILVFIGLKLAAPKEFIHAYRIGIDQLLIFVVTLSVTVSHDLLSGVGAGIITKIIIHLISFRSFKDLLKPVIRVRAVKDKVVIQIRGALCFTNYLLLKNVIEQEVKKSPKELRIDLCSISFVDHTSLEKLSHLQELYPEVKVSFRHSPQLVKIYGNDSLSVLKRVENEK